MDFLFRSSSESFKDSESLSLFLSFELDLFPFLGDGFYEELLTEGLSLNSSISFNDSAIYCLSFFSKVFSLSLNLTSVPRSLWT